MVQMAEDMIALLRLQAPLDPLLLRLRLETVMSSARLHPQGLPPAAIVCIRSLRSTMPHDVSGWRARAWEQKVRTIISDTVRSAARPALGAVPANAEAVLFIDRAEMLACLASDWCDGRVGERWWWRSLLKGADSRSMVLNAWGDAPEYVPAALEHLANRGMAVQFVRNIGNSGLRILLRSVTGRYAMAELAAQVAAIPDFVIASPAERESTITDEVTARETEAILLPDGLPHTAPWQSLVPECSGAGLNPLQQCLLGVGLMLARAPHVTRSLSFATAVRHWSRLEPDTERNTEHVQVTAEEVHVTVGESFSQSEVHAAVSTKAEQRSKIYAVAGPDAPTNPGQLNVAAGPDAPTNPGQLNVKANWVLPLTPVGSARTGAVDRHLPKPKPGRLTDGPGERTADTIMQPSLSEQAAARKAGLADSAVLLETSINTELGGLFYLINLGLFLDLYGDFTSPLQPGIPLPVWDFVALTGWRLLGDINESDPVWLLLSRLSGRCDSDARGKDFEPPDRWQLPAEWLSPFSEPGPWQWSAKDGRLKVRHPEGFLVLDLPLDVADPLEQVRRETEAYGQVVTFELESVAEGGCYSATSPLDRWLDRLMPYLEARLKRALGFSEAGKLPHVLCRHKARVSVTGAHVDVFFALDEHPVEIRLAGLDRNPGWVPAAGRFIAFHYE